MAEPSKEAAEALATRFWRLRTFPSESLPEWEALPPELKKERIRAAQSFIDEEILPIERERWKKELRKRLEKEFAKPFNASNLGEGYQRHGWRGAFTAWFNAILDSVFVKGDQGG